MSSMSNDASVTSPDVVSCPDPSRINIYRFIRLVVMAKLTSLDADNYRSVTDLTRRVHLEKHVQV